MGRNGGLMDKMPGMGKIPQSVKNQVIGDTESSRMVAIINSMTPKERNHINLIKGSRKKRIADGSGTDVQQVNKLLSNLKRCKKQ